MATFVADSRDDLDLIAADIAAMFDEAEQRLRAALARQVAAGLAEQPDDVARALRLAELRRDAEQITARLRGLLPDEIDRLLAVAREDGALAALQEMAALTDVPDPTVPVRALPSAPAAQALTAELTNALDDVTVRILRWPDDVYRRAVAQSTTDMLLGAGTSRTVQARSWQQLVSRGVTGFVDKANRRWNLATYVEMATRTAARRAWEQQHTATMVEHGVDLVSIVVGSGACADCSRWAGKVLRIDSGPTGFVQVPAADDATRTAWVHVAGTLAEARATGWHHPNCRCRPVAYLPGLTVIEDVTTYDPDAERARARLRELERETRKAKADAAAAVDGLQRRAANERVRELQGRIREHIADTGLMRQRHREQISYGQRRRLDGPTTTRRRPLPSQR